ncbi:hypothetical protein [Salinigranum marinum]|uniref:hypothetical protein n=1 Tax=Salinigranum marinum TaxID=1515595 RepID=UPI002989BE69|nr:hypothetical protein [Salinigranum marinum]
MLRYSRSGIALAEEGDGVDSRDGDDERPGGGQPTRDRVRWGDDRREQNALRPPTQTASATRSVVVR